MRSPWEIIRKSLALKLIATAGLSLVLSVAALSWVAIIHHHKLGMELKFLSDIIYECMVKPEV